MQITVDGLCFVLLLYTTNYSDCVSGVVGAELGGLRELGAGVQLAHVLLRLGQEADCVGHAAGSEDCGVALEESVRVLGGVRPGTS